MARTAVRGRVEAGVEAGGEAGGRSPSPAPAWVKVRRSRIHNVGVFAARVIPAGTRILEYVGERVTKREGTRRAEEAIRRASKDRRRGCVYIFTLNNRHDIDGDVPHNVARWVNHSCAPNCETRIIRGHIWVVALRDIGAGEELTYNYGYELDVCEDHPCRCGAPECLGYILARELWRAFRRRRARS